MEARKKAVVIGGGIAGLSAGCYLQINGFDTEVLEMAPTPGGVTAAWRRDNYLFDGGTNWFPGSGPALNFYPILNELFDFGSHDIIDFDIFMQIRRENGDVFNVYTDTAKLKAEMLRIAPEDKKTITEFIAAVNVASKLKLPVDKARELYGVSDYLKAGVSSVPLALFYSKWRKITIDAFAGKFSNAGLRHLFTLIFPRHSYFSVLGVIMALAWMNIRAAGYPMGGSKWVVSSLSKRFQQYGGELKCSSKVEEIEIDNNAAAGVRMQDGSFRKAHVVVAACDGFSTYSKLLGGKYMTEDKKKFFMDTPVYPSLIQVSLGVSKDLSAFVHKTVMEFSPPLLCGKDSIDVLQARFCHFDPCFAPPGHTSVVVHLRTHDFDYWVHMRKNNTDGYYREKKRVADRVIGILESYCGSLRENIETMDVATPATYIRYNDTYKGSYQSWAPVPGLIGRSLEKRIPTLNNFYMCGQWVEPAGGLPRAVFSARNVVQLICADTGRTFSTQAG